MSLYGIDLIVQKDGREFLTEINGINAGMNGFRQIYGDNRVQEEVFRMLQEKYGKLTVNNGSFILRMIKENAKKKTSKEFEVPNAALEVSVYEPLFKKALGERAIPDVLKSEKADLTWKEEKVKRHKKYKLPFEIYDGQESTVLNIVNQELPHPLVNPYVAQELANNKFLQYEALKSSSIKNMIIESSLVGLGFACSKDLEKIMEKNDNFVRKPILGSCGKGFQILTRQELKKGMWYWQGPVKELNILDMLKLAKKFEKEGGEAIKDKLPKTYYLEDFAKAGDYTFEPAMFLLQPLIDSKRRINRKNYHAVVRAIVCNGKFVDAYMRYSLTEKVNLSQGANSRPFKMKGFDKTCEEIVRVFESETSKYKSDNFKKILYDNYFATRTRDVGGRQMFALLGMFNSMRGDEMESRIPQATKK